jgi:hypothetical protein
MRRFASSTVLRLGGGGVERMGGGGGGRELDVEALVDLDLKHEVPLRELDCGVRTLSTAARGGGGVLRCSRSSLGIVIFVGLAELSSTTTTEPFAVGSYTMVTAPVTRHGVRGLGP